MKKKLIAGLIALVIGAGIIVGFTFFRNHKNNLSKYKEEAVTRGDIEALVVTSGTLNPVTIVEVGSQVSGRIARLYADFNSPVREGQVVAELDQSLFVTKVEQNEANYQSAIAALEKAKVNLDIADKKYKRALSLFEGNLISFDEKESTEAQYYSAKTDVQSNEARVEQAKSQLESSRVDLAYTVIKSPVDGIVISRDVNVGQTVAASFQAPVLFKIARDLSEMQVECSIDEADIGKIKEGQKAKFTVDAYPRDIFAGTVTQVRYSPEVVQNVVTYTTIVAVDNPEMKLRPGMTATVSVTTGEAKNVLIVPNSALRFTPPLTPEEMGQAMKEVREKVMAQRKEAGQQEGPQVPRESSRPMEGGGPMGALSNQQGRNPGQGMSRMQASRVWIEDEKGKLWPVFLRPGVSDNTHTEVIWGDLKEGQLIITGLAEGVETESRPRMLFIPR